MRRVGFNNRATSTKVLGIAVLGSLALGGCASALRTPPPPYAVLPPAPAGSAAQMQWRWQDLGDRRFGDVLQRALAGNVSVQSALLRVRQARLAHADAGAEGMPQGSARLGGDTSSPLQALKVKPGFSAGFDASYEIDLWGRIAASRTIADHELSASVHDAETARIAVAGELADIWFALAENAALRTLQTQQESFAAETFRTVAARVRAGVLARSELARAQTDVERARLRSDQIGVERARLINALAVLLGELPGQTAAPDIAGSALVVRFADSAIPLPALAARPDVAAAEDRIWAAAARTDQARAQLLPSLSLTAGVGTSGATLARLLSPQAMILTVAGALAQTVFDGGVKRRRVQSAGIDTDRAVLDYRQVVLKAVEETSNAQNQFASLDRQITAAHHRLAAQEQVLRATQTRNRLGVAPLADLLRDRTTLAQESEDLIRLQRQRAQAAITLLKATGRSPEL